MKDYSAEPLPQRVVYLNYMTHVARKGSFFKDRSNFDTGLSPVSIAPEFRLQWKSNFNPSPRKENIHHKWYFWVTARKKRR